VHFFHAPLLVRFDLALRRPHRRLRRGGVFTQAHA
jgi:hypothetical protein